jgi:hypothetical protein
MGCSTKAPFLHLKQDLEKIFDVTCLEGTTLRFLNLRIVQSPNGVSMDQTNHIKSKVLHDYFLDVPLQSIPKTFYPFPIESSFEQLLNEAPPLVGHAL